MTGSRYGRIQGYNPPEGSSIPAAEIKIDFNGISNWYSTWLYI